MRFVALMAWREVRASWRRLVLFFLCIALGVGAMVSLRSFTQGFAGSIVRDSRMLLSGDVLVENSEPWTAEQIEILTRHSAGPSVLGTARLISTHTMVRAEGGRDVRPVMVELRGVEPAFPLRGEVRLEDGRPYSHTLLARRGALVPASVVERLGTTIGDRLVIGSLSFTVRGILERVPGNGLNFSPLPRVVVDYGDVAAAGLTGFGSRVEYDWLFKVEQDQEQGVAQAIGAEYQGRHIRGRISTFHYVENWLTASLANIDGFLSLIGLAMVVLGGIGIASVTRVFVQQRVRTVAILKCLGGRSRRVLGAYVAQVLILALGGSLLGLLIAQTVMTLGSGYASRRIPIDLDPRLSLIACIQGVAVGLLVALLFALPPLLEIRNVKPILVLRREPGTRRRFDWPKIASQALIACAILLLAGSMAGSYRHASLFIGGMAATVVGLHVAGTILMTVLARIRRLPSFVLRQGVGSLYRPGNQTRVTLFTVGLGALFVISVRLFQVNIQQEYAFDLSGLSADMFMIDIQPPQEEAVRDVLSRHAATDVSLIPMARGRLVRLTQGGTDANRPPPPPVGGEYRLPSRILAVNETIVAGSPWPEAQPRRPEVGIEQGHATWWNLRTGDSLVFDIAGRRVEALVTLVFKQDRRMRTVSSLTRSDIVVRPGSLNDLPYSLIGGAKGPTDPTARARLQNDFASRFPGVTIVDALDDIAEVRKRVGEVSQAVSILGGFVLGCGVLILVGSVAMTKMHRLYESAVLKTLGAKRRVLVGITVIEHGVLGSLAGMIGSGAAIGLTWVMSFVGNRPLPWHFQPLISATGALVTAIVVVIVGIAATWDVVARKPLATLRELS